jgi:ornithine cyclodeaminase
MQEYSIESIKAMDTIYVDTPFAQVESGDLGVPLKSGVLNKESIHPFYEAKQKSGNILFKSVGMALFDICVADFLYLACKKQNLGIKLEAEDV